MPFFVDGRGIAPLRNVNDRVSTEVGQIVVATGGAAAVVGA
jgi:hypothetical protein